MTPDEIKYLKVAKYKCLKSSLFFTRYFFKQETKRKLIIDKHHELICDALDRVIQGKCRRLIINIGPRFGKTEIAVKKFIAKGLAHNPAAKFIHLTASAELALENSEAARDTVKSQAYQALFPHVQIKGTTDAKKKWYTTMNGGVYATGSSGQVTGFGAGLVDEDKELDSVLSDLERSEGFGGAIIWDDAIKAADADSEVVREAVNRKYNTTVKNRTNSRNTPIIVIGQRLHPDDLPGYLMRTEPGEWEVLSLPALYQEDGEYKALCNRLYSVPDLLKMQNSDNPETKIFFERQLQQNPQPREGLMFALDALKMYNPKTTDVNKLAEYRFMFVDPADTGGDDLAAPIGYLIGDKIYIDDVIYNAHGTEVNENRIIDKIRKDKIDKVDFEGVGGWQTFGTTIRRKLYDTGWQGDLRIVKPYTNKHTRILAQESFILNNFIFREDWQTCSPEYAKYIKNLTDYRRIQTGASKNAHDDAPDASAGVAAFFRAEFGHLW